MARLRFHNIGIDDDLWERLRRLAFEESSVTKRVTFSDLLREGAELRLAQPRVQVPEPPVLKSRKPIQSAQEFGEENAAYLTRGRGAHDLPGFKDSAVIETPTITELQKRARSASPAQGQTFDYPPVEDFWPPDEPARPEGAVQLGQFDAVPMRPVVPEVRTKVAKAFEVPIDSLPEEVPVRVVDLPPNTTPEQAGEQMKKAMAIAQKAGVALGREFHPVPKPSTAKRTRR